LPLDLIFFGALLSLTPFIGKIKINKFYTF